jgi:hypothetical protein
MFSNALVSPVHDDIFSFSTHAGSDFQFLNSGSFMKRPNSSKSCRHPTREVSDMFFKCGKLITAPL